MERSRQPEKDLHNPKKKKKKNMVEKGTESKGDRPGGRRSLGGKKGEEYSLTILRSETQEAEKRRRELLTMAKKVVQNPVNQRENVSMVYQTQTVPKGGKNYCKKKRDTSKKRAQEPKVRQKKNSCKGENGSTAMLISGSCSSKSKRPQREETRQKRGHRNYRATKRNSRTENCTASTFSTGTTEREKSSGTNVTRSPARTKMKRKTEKNSSKKLAQGGSGCLGGKKAHRNLFRSVNPKKKTLEINGTRTAFKKSHSQQRQREAKNASPETVIPSSQLFKAIKRTEQKKGKKRACCKKCQEQRKGGVGGGQTKTGFSGEESYSAVGETSRSKPKAGKKALGKGPL